MTVNTDRLEQPGNEVASEITIQPSRSTSELGLINNSSSEQDFKRALAVSRLSQTFDSLLGKVDVAQEIVEQVGLLFNAPAAFIAEAHIEPGLLAITAWRGLHIQAFKTFRIEAGKDVCGEVFSSGQMAYSLNIQQDLRFEQIKNLPQSTLDAFVAVPLTWRGARVGILGIYLGPDWGMHGKLTKNEEDIIQAAAGLIGQVLYNSHLIKESENARNDFTDMLVYGLKGPMASIMGALDLLYDSQGPDAQAARLLTIARRNGARMLTMIETLLDLNKLEHGDLQLDLEKVRLQQLAEITWQTVEDQLRAKGLEGRVNVPAERIVLRIDLSRVLKVLHHILENAIYFTEHGSIEIWAEQRVNAEGEKEVVIAISDTGCGIPPERLAELFDRFSRARQYRQLDLASGGGIGLNYAKLVINAHDGKIWAESPGRLGSGTSLYFTVPLA